MKLRRIYESALATVVLFLSSISNAHADAIQGTIENFTDWIQIGTPMLGALGLMWAGLTFYFGDRQTAVSKTINIGLGSILIFAAGSIILLVKTWIG